MIAVCMIELIDGLCLQITNGCAFATERIDLLCQLDYLTDLVKMAVMTTRVSVGIWICVHLTVRSRKAWTNSLGANFSLVAEGFSRFQGPAPKYSSCNQHHAPPILHFFCCRRTHHRDTYSPARQCDGQHAQIAGAWALLEQVRHAYSVTKDQLAQPNKKWSESHGLLSRLASGPCLP